LSNNSHGSEPWLLVSGGGGGIGSAVCVALAERGIRPFVGYHRSETAARVLAERCAGRALALDLTDPDSIGRAVQELEQCPRLVGAVLAGSPPLSLAPFCNVTPSEMYEQWQVNVLGPQQLLAALVKRCFRKRKAGSVVGVLSQAMGSEQAAAAPGMGAYVIAKHGMAGVLALLAADHPWLHVRTVKPGFTETAMLEAFDPRFLELQRQKAAFQTPKQVAALILQEALPA
jgi:NAD(P)-dependent dehydrogenase (short-subunit alcohol dehydrogenase family)